jgi:hypothetical protein
MFSISKMKEFDPEAPDMAYTSGHYYFQWKSVMGGLSITF